MTASQPPQPPEGGRPPAGAQPPEGQAHEVPRTAAPGEQQHGGSSQGEPGPGPYEQPGYGRPPSGQAPYAPPGYGQPQSGQPPYGQPPYGQPPYGQPGYGGYGQHPYGQPGYGHPGPGQPQFGHPYGQPGYGGYGQPPSAGPGQGYGQQPHGQPAPVPPGYGWYAPGYPAGRRPGGAEFSFDPKRLAWSDLGVAGGTLLFLLVGFLPWWRFGDATFGVTFSGFEDGMVVAAFVLFLLATTWAVLPAFVRTTPTFPRSGVTAGLAGLGLVLTLFSWLDTLRYAFSFWAFLGFLTAVGTTVVAVLGLRRELRERPARPAVPQHGGPWPGQPYPWPPSGQPWAPGPQPYPHQQPPWPAQPASGQDPGTGGTGGTGGATASGEAPGTTQSDRPGTET